MISCHLREMGGYLIMVGYICYRENNHGVNNEFETEQDDDSEATRHGGLGCGSIPVCVV